MHREINVDARLLKLGNTEKEFWQVSLFNFVLVYLNYPMKIDIDDRVCIEINPTCLQAFFY